MNVEAVEKSYMNTELIQEVMDVGGCELVFRRVEVNFAFVVVRPSIFVFAFVFVGLITIGSNEESCARSRRRAGVMFLHWSSWVLMTCRRA